MQIQSPVLDVREPGSIGRERNARCLGNGSRQLEAEEWSRWRTGLQCPAGKTRCDGNPERAQCQAHTMEGSRRRRRNDLVRLVTPCERNACLSNIAEALLGVALEAPLDHPAQDRRRVWGQRVEVRRVLDDGGDHFGDGLPAEKPAAR